MAAEMGLSPEILETEAFSADHVLEKTSSPGSDLMERLRGRCSQHKSWTDSMKAIRLAIANDKRLPAEALEKSSLQNCLDKLHRAMKITNQQSLIERLDLISRQLGMIFTPPSHLENQVVLSSDMFKVVILLEGQSGIKDVRVGHQDSPSSCEDMVEALSSGNFEEFVSHLQGLLSIYSIQGDRKQKVKGYLALSSLESDLNQIAQLQSSISGVANYIHKSSLGILLPRRGGHPMKLIYYVSPYDLLCKETNSSYPMTVEAITEHGLGHSVTVSLEPCPHINKLQTMPLMSVRTSQDGKSLQSFQNVNSINSCSLPASFVLNLAQPLPVAKSVIDAIKDITGLDVITDGETPFLPLLLKHCSSQQLTSKNELFVTLPDQQHVYVFNSTESFLGQPGALVRKIPFTLPTCVPKVLNLLRQQLMFSSVLHSLVRPYTKRVNKTGIVFEVTAVSLQYISLMFEHPLHHSMITVDFDLSDITSVKSIVNKNNREEDFCSSDVVSKTFQRSFSIPVTLRSVIKRVNEQVRLMSPPKPVCKPVVKSRLKWTQPNIVKHVQPVSVNNPVLVQNSLTSLPNPPPYSSAESWNANQQIEMHKYSIQFNRTFSEQPVPIPEEYVEQRPAANPLLATLLDAGSPAVEPQHIPVASESPMLSKLLEENTSVASNLFPAPTPNPRKRLTKRKSSKDISGKSPKHRLSDSDMAERTSMADRPGTERHGQGMGEKHIDLDSSGGSYEEMPRPSSVSSVGSTGAHSTGSVIDLTDSCIGESHVKKLENSLDSLMGKESPRLHMGGHPMNSQLSGLDMMDLQFGDFHSSQTSNQMLGDGVFDFIPPPQWPSRQTPPTPTTRNSPHHGVVPKNEKTSTSLEELLLGPGGRENEGPISAQPRRTSHPQRRLMRQNSLGRNSVDSAIGSVSPDVFSPLMTSPSHLPLTSSPSHIVSPIIYPPISPSHNSSVTSPSLQNLVKNEPQDSKHSVVGSQAPVSSSGSRISSIHGGHITSSGKPSLSMLKAQLDMKNDVKQSTSAITQVESDASKEESSNSSTCSSLKLKLTNKRNFGSVSSVETDENKRSSTFDFHSDDEDFTLPRVEKMTVVSSSPTRLQISNKSTLASFNRFNKSEKFKRKQQEKELKMTLSVDSGKRKREKDESRKEKKKKKLVNNSYSIENERALYKSKAVVESIGDENDQYKPMPKLKITKEGVKMSIENSALESKGLKVDKVLGKDRSQKEAVVKLEKMERSLTSENAEKALKNEKEYVLKQEDGVKTVEKEKVSLSVGRIQSTSDEGIFDRINAMKTESTCVSKGDTENHTPNYKSSHSALKKSGSSKSSKTQKSHRLSSSKSDSKMSRTPTIKLKPIVVSSNSNSAGLNPCKNSSNPGTPSTPKSITQSPTSATIGKIGAVSLATSGSQKQLGVSNKSPQGPGSGVKSSLPTSKPSPGSSTLSASKSGSTLQKNFQIQGPSGKNSPVSQIGNKSRSGSSSSSASGLKLDKLTSKSSRTSSPHLEKEKTKSRSSSSSSRDREKSSSSKSSTPTAVTPDTTASVLSFLSHNKLAKLPPIPKLSSSTSSSQRVSTPTSASSPIVTTSNSSSTNTTVTTNSKLSKGGNPVTSVSKTSSPKLYHSTGVKNNHYSKHDKVSGHSNSNRPKNLNVKNAAFTSRNSNSPQGLSNKGSNSSNKGVNQSSVNNANANSGYRNNYNSSAQNRNPNANSTGGQSHWGNSPVSGSQGNKVSSSNQSAMRGSNLGQSGSKFNHSAVDSPGNRTPPVNNSNVSYSRNTNSIPNAPKGPGPPARAQGSGHSEDKEKNTHGSSHPSRGRKGSLSAVIDKLTCKATVPPTGSNNILPKAEQVIVNESPASPEMEPVVPSVTEDKKVVIFEAPASPEPEVLVNSVPKSNIECSSSETVSIPLESDFARSNTNDYSGDLSANRTNDSIKRHAGSHSKSSVTLNSSPKIIPLNSPKEKSNSNKVISHHTNNVMPRKNNVGIINSIEKQNGEVETDHISNDNFEYSVNSSSDSVQVSKPKDSVFKIPSQKSQDLSTAENSLDDSENSKHRNHCVNSNPKSNSASPPSSPENGLVIDFPSSPNHMQNKNSSPHFNLTSDSIGDSRTSPIFLRSPSLKGTPGKENSSLGSNSPECLEDDLMDEALGFGN